MEYIDYTLHAQYYHLPLSSLHILPFSTLWFLTVQNADASLQSVLMLSLLCSSLLFSLVGFLAPGGLLVWFLSLLFSSPFYCFTCHTSHPHSDYVSGPLYPRRSQWAKDSQVFLVRLVPRFPEPIASGRLSKSTKDEAKSTEGNLANKGLSPN